MNEKSLKNVLGFEEEEIKADSTPIEFGLDEKPKLNIIPSKTIDGETADNLALGNGSSAFDKFDISDEHFAKVQQKLEAAGSIENIQKIKDESGLPNVDNIDSILSGGNLDRIHSEREKSVLLMDPEVKARTVKEFDSLFKQYATDRGEIEGIYHSFGIIDENGESIPESERNLGTPVEREIDNGETESTEYKKAMKEVDEITREKTLEMDKTINVLQERKKGVLSPTSNSKMEKYNKRKRKGYNFPSYLGNSNLMIRAYPMDTTFKKADLLDDLRYANTTMLYTERMFKMIFDHTSILARDGADMTYYDFINVVHLDDIDDILMAHTIVGTKGKPLQGYRSKCNSDDPKACKKVTEWEHDLDIMKIFKKCSSEHHDYIDRWNKYNVLNTIDENLKASGMLDKHILNIEDKYKEEVIRMEFTKPTIAKYFKRINKVKEALIHIMSSEEAVSKYIDNVEGWDMQPLDTQILILATSKFPDVKKSFANNMLKAQLFVFLDRVEIIPRDIANDTSIKDITKHEDYISIEMDNDPVELWMEFMYDIDANTNKAIDNLMQEELKPTIERSFVYTEICPECGCETKPEEFSPREVFSYWISSDSE